MSDPVVVPFQFINRPRTFMGYAMGTDRNQFGHYILKLPKRLLGAYPYVHIVGAWLQSDGYTGGGGGAFLVFHDAGLAATNEGNNPLTQNANYISFDVIGQMRVRPMPEGIRLSKYFDFGCYPIRHVPGVDGVVVAIDGAPSSNPVGHVVILRVALPGETVRPAWLSNKGADIPDPTCATGNDQFTRLLLHCDGPDGSPNFYDSSFRNYSTRFLGDVRQQGGWAHFGGAGVLAPELYSPGYGVDGNPSHSDWNPGAGDFCLDFKIRPSASTASAGVAGFTKWYGPFLIRQFGSSLGFYATTANSVWNVADCSPMGSCAIGVETHLAVSRSGSTLQAFNNGVPMGSYNVGTTPLFYPLDASGGPKGRLIFGTQGDVDVNGVIDAQPGNFAGDMREIRWSRGIARWTAAFTPPAGPYTP